MFVPLIFKKEKVVYNYSSYLIDESGIIIKACSKRKVNNLNGIVTLFSSNLGVKWNVEELLSLVDFDFFNKSDQLILLYSKETFIHYIFTSLEEASIFMNRKIDYLKRKNRENVCENHDYFWFLCSNEYKQKNAI